MPTSGPHINATMVRVCRSKGSNNNSAAATVALAAQFHSIVWVVIGTTVGMMLANVPVVFAGDALIRRVPLKVVRIVTALSFAALGVYVLVTR